MWLSPLGTAPLTHRPARPARPPPPARTTKSPVPALSTFEPPSCHNRRMAFVRVASLSRLAAGSVVEASIGDERYAICNVDGRIHALAGTCPHRGGPL